MTFAGGSLKNAKISINPRKPILSKLNVLIKLSNFNGKKYTV